ncbi:MAG: saccharopine dehydrogenase NADP-binding domain-containing protein [Nitrosospira sp.]|nr:saccharopine dehydrogenase NADP-binding domain-containing protein [Nitrosospira sp.]
MSRSATEFDLVVYGAASFVGRLLTRYLVQRHGVDGDLRWALAGRNQAKLEAVAAEFGAQSLPLIIADAGDRPALDAMVARTGVVVSTVGPYALHGSELVAACVDGGTDYCDLTGEPQWMLRMIDAHGDRAAQTGARIVHNCGFDSIPSDMGVWFTQQQAMEQFGESCKQIKMRVKAASGGFSGGTVASLMNVITEAKRDAGLRKLLQNPYALCPVGMRRGVRQPNVKAPVHDPDFNAWLAPFVMAAINTRVVHRSNALRDHVWGQDFLYDEAMLTGGGVMGAARAGGLAGGIGGFMALVAFGPTQSLLSRYLLPKPGQGPSAEDQEKGFFRLRFFGRTESGKSLMTEVTGDRDPGYGSTARMLGEAAVCMGSVPFFL